MPLYPLKAATHVPQPKLDSAARLLQDPLARVVPVRFVDALPVIGIKHDQA
jgi:hypothetical protein